MLKTSTIATIFVAAFMLAGTASEAYAQSKGGSKGGGGGAGGSDPMSTRGMGDPRAGSGFDRVYDPTGARSKDPFTATSERVYDPTGSRGKEPLFVVSERQRPYDLMVLRSKPSIPVLTQNEIRRYGGIAKMLNTTPNVLSNSYLAALNSDPKLTFGQYVAANVIADNLKKRFPTITAANILAGLQNGDSLGRTLRKLGLDSDEAKNAQREAKRQIADSRESN